jgi:hypothetical protein
MSQEIANIFSRMQEFIKRYSSVNKDSLQTQLDKQSALLQEILQESKKQTRLLESLSHSMPLTPHSLSTTSNSLPKLSQMKDILPKRELTPSASRLTILCQKQDSFEALFNTQESKDQS